jgi:hypothetical protein
MNAFADLPFIPSYPSLAQRRALFAKSTVATPASHATGFRTGMHSTPVEQVLAKNQLLALPDAKATLVCLEGELWVTREGDSEDCILGPGRSFSARRGDRVVVQALQASRIRLSA